MPLRWPASFEGASFCRVTANRWREAEEGEKCMVDGVWMEAERVMGTRDQVASVGLACGVHGASAMCAILSWSVSAHRC